MQRRTFLVGTAAVLVTGTLGLQGARHLQNFDLAALAAQLQSWQRQRIDHRGQWSASEIFQHCAQSIAGSLDGYPEHRPALFQHTAGALALQVFQAAGQMHHPLAEVIPGMPALQTELSSDQALSRLLAEITRFLAAAETDLQPHFAYGRLTKADYQAAHWLHLSQHLTELSLR